MTQHEKRMAVIAEARTWLGTPYHHMARVKGGGVDCAQILLDVFEACGLLPQDVEIGYYPPDWHFHREEERYLGGIAAHAHEVETPLPGDVALFKFGKCVSHGAIVIEWPLVIHAYFRQGVVLASAEGSDLGGRLHSFWSLFPREGD